MLSTRPVFTAGNTKSQASETKHVSNRELCVPLQLPIGDDVSALNPLRSSVALCFECWHPGTLAEKAKHADRVPPRQPRGMESGVLLREVRCTNLSTVAALPVVEDKLWTGMEARRVRVDYCPIDRRPGCSGMG